MSASKHSLSKSCLVLTLALLLHAVLGANPIGHSCSGSKNSTANSPYEYDLKAITNILKIVTPRSGYSQASLNSAYGLSLCRGDVSYLDCANCLKDAASEIRKRCEYNAGGIIWYDDCMYKYLDYDFFGQIDNRVKIFIWNTKNASDPATFNQKTKYLLSRLANEASANPKMYASGEVELGESKKKVYGLTQCTRDLSTVDCHKCLDDAINELVIDGKEGGRVAGGSCSIRYEMFRFLGA